MKKLLLFVFAIIKSLSLSAADESIFTIKDSGNIIYVESYHVVKEKVHYKECVTFKKGTIPKNQIVIFKKNNACLLVDKNLQKKYIDYLSSILSLQYKIEFLDYFSPASSDKSKSEFTAHASALKVKFPYEEHKGNDFKVIVSIANDMTLSPSANRHNAIQLLKDAGFTSEYFDIKVIEKDK